MSLLASVLSCRKKCLALLKPFNQLLDILKACKISLFDILREFLISPPCIPVRSVFKLSALNKSTARGLFLLNHPRFHWTRLVGSHLQEFVGPTYGAVYVLGSCRHS